MAMQVALVMFRGEDPRRTFPLSRSVTVIGRREDCDLRIPLSDVSRKHCRIYTENGELRLQDLGSSNGTYLNGQRIQESVLSAGDNVRVGPVMFVVQINGVPAEDEIQAPVANPNTDTSVNGQTPAAAGAEEELDLSMLEELEDKEGSRGP
jgi:pSer/pThr/pTyr-binding forkhead associated (FHA) protein